MMSDTDTEPVAPVAVSVDELEARYHDAAFMIGESIIQNLGLYPHHLASYEHLLSSLLPKIISEQSPIVSTDSRKSTVHHVFFENPVFCRPAQEDEPGVYKSYRARDMHAPKLTLLSSVRVSVRHKVYSQDTATGASTGRMILRSHVLAHNITLFELPVMDGSELTNDFDDLDSVNRERYASTLVINGYRKSVLIQTRLRNNFPFVRFLASNNRYECICEIRSAHRNKMRSSSTSKVYLTREKPGTLTRVMVALPFVPGKLPITVLFRILGVVRLRDMVALVSSETEDYATFSRARAILLNCPGRLDPMCNSMNASVDDMLVYVATTLRGAQATGSVKTLGSRSRESHIASMRKLLASEILPHIGSAEDAATLAAKASFLGMSLARLLALHEGTVKADDRDSCVHKRFSTAGQTLAIKIRQLLRNHCKMLSAAIARNLENNKHVDIRELMKTDNVTRPLRSCLARGNFSVGQSDNSTQAGVSQVVNSMNRIARIAHMTTVNQPLSRDGSQSSARQLRPGHWGIIDAAHTPDGRGIGLVSHHTLFADFRPGHDGDTLVALVTGLGLCQPLSTNARRAPTLVVVNDEAVARTAFPQALMALLRCMRGDLALPKDVSVRFALGCLYLRGDEGEAIRPVLRADKIDEILELVQRYGHYTPHLLYPQLLAAQCLEYLTKAEESTMRVAHSFRQLETEGEAAEGAGQPFTHVEIDPTMALYGAVSGLIPHSNHNQGPRDVYFCAMAPQAMGGRHPMFHEFQLDVQSHVLDYPQKQMARTATSRLVQGEEDDESITQLYMVAVLPADGLGQEDAVVGNAASFQRGLGVSTKYTTLREVASAHGTCDREYFCYPPDGPGLVNRKAGSAHGIDHETGLLKEGVTLQPGDIYCGKVLDCVVNRATPGTGQTEAVRRIVDRSSAWKGNGPATVDSVRKIRRNGVTSLIIRMREAHMPEVGDKFSSLHAQKGVMSALWAQEDLPFTPEGYTPDLLFSSHGLSSRMTIGMLREMVGTQIGLVEGRTFDATAFRVVPVNQEDEAARKGLGMHTFMCGKTGMLIGRGFLCMASYMLQRHTVAGKVHARARGPRNAVTRQAVEGRSNNGGLKMGTMEMSTLASSGSIATLTETMTLHDGRECVVCGCGRVMETPRELLSLTCGGCDGSEGGARTIFIPHVTLVLYWELLCSGVEMRFIPDMEAVGDVRMGGGGPVMVGTDQPRMELL